MKTSCLVLFAALLALAGCARPTSVQAPPRATPAATADVLHCAEPLPESSSKPPHCARFEWVSMKPGGEPAHKLGQQLVITGGSASPSTPLAGDVGGTLGANVVNKISGSTPILITPNVLEWIAAASAPTLMQATPTSDVATVPLLIQSQAPWASAVTNVKGGNVVLSVPLSLSGTPQAFVQFNSGANIIGGIGPFWGAPASNTNLWLLPAGTAATAGNYSLTASASALVLNGTSSVNVNVNGSAVNTTSASVYSWGSAVAAPLFTQTALASTSAGSGAAGQPLAVTAQAGQAATGGGNNGGAGGVLTLAAGAGGTSGSATAGARGTIGLLGLIGGSGTTPLGFVGQTSPNTVACGTGGTQTISAAQAVIPFFLLTSGTLTSNCIVDFGTNAVTGAFIIDVSGLGALGAFTVGFKNGTTTKTISATQLTNLIATGASAAQVYTFGTNNITIVDFAIVIDDEMLEAADAANDNTWKHAAGE